MALTLSDINLFVTTDVHSFIASHAHTDGLCGAMRCDADFGTLTSFWQRMRERADALGKDIFIFDNGDVVDGTGLSTATKIDGAAVFPLLMAMPYDALNCGNHELYQSSTVLHGLLGPMPGGRSFVDSWNGSYLTSNIILSSTGAALGARYTRLVGKHGTRLLVMGWMYEMPDNCEAVNVTSIAAAINEPWFAEAMAEAAHANAIVVLAHMHYIDPLVSELLHAIRSRAGPNIPVQFLTGHSHIRAWARLDGQASSFEAGNYGDTVGFAAFNRTSSSGRAANKTQFDYAYVEMRRAALIDAVGAPVNASTFDTPQGIALSERILATRASFGLSRLLGCSPVHYEASAPLESNLSLYSLYTEYVAPAAIFTPPHNASQWFVTSTGALRYDLYAGNITIDDIDMTLPFADELYVVQRVKGETLTKALRMLQSSVSEDGDDMGGLRYRPLRAPIGSEFPSFLATAAVPAAGQYFDAIVGRFDKVNVAKAIQMVLGSTVTLVPYDSAAVAPGGASTPPATDTDAWIRWARSLPQPPCV